ncbi:MAG: hypothetical protein IH851_11660 [Armatimonadetes bacterium]|nr:hypothetical protein [Armatimonadota bacterium]
MIPVVAERWAELGSQCVSRGLEGGAVVGDDLFDFGGLDVAEVLDRSVVNASFSGLVE